MTKEFIEIAKMRFSGPRYSAHKLDTLAMRELINLQEVLIQSVESYKLREYSFEQKLSGDDREKYTLYLADLEPGITVATIQVFHDDTENVFDYPPAHEEVKNRMVELFDVISAAEENNRFPDNTDRGLFKGIRKIGGSLPADCTLELCVPHREWVPMTSKSKQRLEDAMASPYTDIVTFQGFVLEANVKTKEFTLWLDDVENIKVDFDPSQEDQITTALKEHNQLQLWLKGVGTFDSNGNIERVTNVAEIRLQKADEIPFDSQAEPIWETISKIAKTLPNDFWSGYPADLSENHDAYLLGEKKFE